MNECLLALGKKGLGPLCLRLYGTGLYPVLRGAVQEREDECGVKLATWHRHDERVDVLAWS